MPTESKQAFQLTEFKNEEPNFLSLAAFVDKSYIYNKELIHAGLKQLLEQGKSFGLTDELFAAYKSEIQLLLQKMEKFHIAYYVDANTYYSSVNRIDNSQVQVIADISCIPDAFSLSKKAIDAKKAFEKAIASFKKNTTLLIEQTDDFKRQDSCLYKSSSVTCNKLFFILMGALILITSTYAIKPLLDAVNGEKLKKPEADDVGLAALLGGILGLIASFIIKEPSQKQKVAKMFDNFGNQINKQTLMFSPIAGRSDPQAEEKNFVVNIAPF